MKLADFIKQYPMRLATSADLLLYQKFVKDQSMATGVLRINFLRQADLLGSFQEQGLQAYPIFLLTPSGEVCGFFSIAIKQAMLDGQACRYGYFSDLKLSTEKSNRAALRSVGLFRKVYHDFLAHQHEVDELQGVDFFMTTILGENRAALRALTRERSGVTYRNLGSYRTEGVFLHPGYFLGRSSRLQLALSSVSAHVFSNRAGLKETNSFLQDSAELSISVRCEDRLIFSALLAKPAKREIELSFNQSSVGSLSAQPRWLLDVLFLPGATGVSFAACLKFVLCRLLWERHLKMGSLLLLRNDLEPSGLFLSKTFTTEFFEVSRKDSPYRELLLKALNLEPAFL